MSKIFGWHILYQYWSRCAKKRFIEQFYTFHERGIQAFITVVEQQTLQRSIFKAITINQIQSVRHVLSPLCVDPNRVLQSLFLERAGKHHIAWEPEKSEGREYSVLIGKFVRQIKYMFAYIPATFLSFFYKLSKVRDSCLVSCISFLLFKFSFLLAGLYPLLVLSVVWCGW